MARSRYRFAFVLVRAAMFAALASAVALLGHVSAGAPAPGARALLLTWAGMALLAVPLALRPRSAGTLTGAVFGAQLLLHTAYTATGAGPPPDGSAVHAIAHACTGGAAVGDGGTGMLTAHLWAALVTGWWLAGGEEALWTLVHRLRAVLAGRAPRARARAAQPRGRPAAPPLAVLRSRLLRHARAGRAPPRISAFA